MTVAEGLMLMIRFGALVVAILSKTINKIHPLSSWLINRVD